jgi:NitT/TauT family transport system ATP-binding protein
MTMSSSAPKLALESVTKRFRDIARGRDTLALDGISFTISDGEFVCLLGASGCGKSTVLNLVAGFEAPTSGEARLDGKPVRKPGTDRGVVFQQPLLFPWLTVLDNIAFGPLMNGASRSEARAKATEYLAFVGLADFARHFPYELSGGMQQRVSLARAWVSHPLMLLMDEPFGALDAQTRLQMQEFLLQIWEERRTTVLFVTHDIDEALFLADRIIVMSARPGRVALDLPLSFSRPRRIDEIMSDAEYIRMKQRVMHAIRRDSGGDQPH